MVARGLSNREIAAWLAVSVGTVRTHVDHILAKLGMHSRAQIAVWAVATGVAPKRAVSEA
jgi:DNA-binding NarL/FixJ family response regulator